MPEENSFWTTLPGILTAIAGIIVAISTLVGALHLAGFFDTPPATPVPTTIQPVRTPTEIVTTTLPTPTDTATPTPTVTGSIQVTGISPSSAYRGTSIDVIIQGTNLKSNTEVAIETNGGKSWYYATNENTFSPTGISCTLDIPPDAPLGYYNVYIRDPVFRGGTQGWIYGRGLFYVR